MRTSTLPDSEMSRRYPEYVIFQEALKYANPDWRPIIPDWDKINVQFLGVGIAEALNGRKTAEAALNDIIPQVKKLMQDGGYRA